MTSLPVLGAAMTLDDVEIHRDWLFEDSAIWNCRASSMREFSMATGHRSPPAPESFSTDTVDGSGFTDLSGA